MASRGNRTEPRRPTPRLYLFTPQVADPAGVRDALVAALDAADVAAVLLRLAAADERTQINCVKALAAVVQDKGVALLLDGLPEIAARGGADGAHVSGVEALEAAQTTLKPERIVGCGGLATRHDAMVAAESGADYVMFGEPYGGGERPSPDAVIDRVGWWAEVFEVPCVGFAGAADEVGPLAAAGAEFVALGAWIFDELGGAAAAIRNAAERLALAEATG